jgi:hypothetical protein
VVRAWYLGSSLVAFVGSDFECTKHLSGMGPVSLVPDGRRKGTFPYYLWGTWMHPLACNSVVPVWVWTFVWEWSSKPCTKECRFRSELKIDGNFLVSVYPISFLFGPSWGMHSSICLGPPCKVIINQLSASHHYPRLLNQLAMTSLIDGT